MNILIVDEQPLLRTGLALFLQTLSEDYRLYQAVSLDDGCGILNTNPIHLVISEISIEGRIGAALIDLFRTITPGISILFYSAFPERLYALPLMRAGADGFISKQARDEEVARAIYKVASGEKYMSVELQVSLLPHMNTGQQIDLKSLKRLSRRESFIMHQVIHGKSTKAIADMLNLKYNTVSTYKKRIYVKMNVADKFELFQKTYVEAEQISMMLQESPHLISY